MISEEQPELWEQLAQAVPTEGWEADYYVRADDSQQWSVIFERVPGSQAAQHWALTPDKETAAFIAASREAVPALAAEVRRLREALRDAADRLFWAFAALDKHKDAEAGATKEAVAAAVKALGPNPPSPTR